MGPWASASKPDTAVQPPTTALRRATVPLVSESSSLRTSTKASQQLDNHPSATLQYLPDDDDEFTGSYNDLEFLCDNEDDPVDIETLSHEAEVIEPVSTSISPADEARILEFLRQHERPPYHRTSPVQLTVKSKSPQQKRYSQSWVMAKNSPTGTLSFLTWHVLPRKLGEFGVVHPISTTCL